MTTKNSNATLQYLIKDLKKIIFYNTDYQREYIWKDSQTKSELILSIMKEYPIGSISLLTREIECSGDNNQKTAKWEIIDGQQRLKTIEHFINNEFGLTPDISRKSIEFLHLNELRNCTKIKFKQLPQYIQLRFMNYNLPLITIDAKDNEVTEYFSYVQNQERLKAGEIIHAIPDNYVSRTFGNKNTEKDYAGILSQILNFNDKRKDILKQLNMIVGLNKNKTRMGVADKEIIKLAKNINDDESKYVDENIDLFFNSLKKDINESLFLNEAIPNYINKNIYRVFSLKLLLCTYLIPDICFENTKLEERSYFIQKVCNFCSYFNSSDLTRREEIKNPIFKEHIENIWKLEKTTHTKNDIKYVFKTHLYPLYNIIDSEVYKDVERKQHTIIPK